MFELLRRNGLNRGFLGGSRPWMVIGGIAYGARMVRWLARRRQEVVFSQEIRPGERLLVTPIAASEKRGRRRR
jgi:hypothetical protein